MSTRSRRVPGRGRCDWTRPSAPPTPASSAADEPRRAGTAVRDLDERRDPEGAWRNRPRLERLLRELDDAPLARLLRMLRVAVRPGSVVSAEAWSLILELSETLVDARAASRRG